MRNLTWSELNKKLSVSISETLLVFIHRHSMKRDTNISQNADKSYIPKCFQLIYSLNRGFPTSDDLVWALKTTSWGGTCSLG